MGLFWYLLLSSKPPQLSCMKKITFLYAQGLILDPIQKAHPCSMLSGIPTGNDSNDRGWKHPLPRWLLHGLRQVQLGWPTRAPTCDPSDIAGLGRLVGLVTQ